MSMGWRIRPAMFEGYGTWCRASTLFRDTHYNADMRLQGRCIAEAGVFGLGGCCTEFYTICRMTNGKTPSTILGRYEKVYKLLLQTGGECGSKMLVALAPIGGR